MTVQQLIDELKKCDPSTRVFVPGYEGGFNDIRPSLEITNMALDVYEEWYYGSHEKVLQVLSDNKKKRYKIVKGIIL
jgi:hypothetical protein